MYSLICAIHPEFKLEWEVLYNDRIHIKFEKLSSESDINGMRDMLNNELYKQYLLTHVKYTIDSWWCDNIKKNEQINKNCVCDQCKLFREYK
jgi:tRNA A37 threonylcarbamoyladenosine dehydratase